MEAEGFPPGFRFHPTDSELLEYYLKRKVMGLNFAFQLISELDLYKFCPWDLPEKSHFQSTNQELYFFCPRNRKYAFGGRANRANEIGYWKVSGRDRVIYHGSRILGMKKILVFYIGRAPRGERTDWVIHEYRLPDREELVQDSYVLCRVFHKSGLGRRNGEQVVYLAEENLDCGDDANDALEFSPPCDQLMIESDYGKKLLNRNQSSSEAVPSSTVTSDEERMLLTSYLDSEHWQPEEEEATVYWYPQQSDKSQDISIIAKTAVATPKGLVGLPIYDGIRNQSIQAEANMHESYHFPKIPKSDSFHDLIWLHENEAPSAELNDLSRNSNFITSGTTKIENVPIDRFNALREDPEICYPSVDDGNIMKNTEVEVDNWLNELFDVIPEELHAPGGIFYLGSNGTPQIAPPPSETGNKQERRPFSDLESFWDSIPARSASAAEYRAQPNDSSLMMRTRLTNEASQGTSSKAHKNHKSKAPSKAGHFGFLRGLALLALAMWLILLVVADKIGFFTYKMILS